MNAPRYEPHARPRQTYTAWPSGRPANTATPPPRAPVKDDDNRDEEHAPEEPGYGHGV